MRLWLAGMRAARRLLSQLSLTLLRLFVLVMRCGRLWEQIGLRPTATVCSAAGNYKEIYRRARLTIDLFFLFLKKNKIKSQNSSAAFRNELWKLPMTGRRRRRQKTLHQSLQIAPQMCRQLIELNGAAFASHSAAGGDSSLRTSGRDWFDQVQFTRQHRPLRPSGLIIFTWLTTLRPDQDQDKSKSNT